MRKAGPKGVGEYIYTRGRATVNGDSVERGEKYLSLYVHGRQCTAKACITPN